MSSMPTRPPKSTLHAGFTLVELSIVLVILGLLVSGVLVGRDLIRAAEIRAVISQNDSFNTAANVFSLKYNALPGDLTQADATFYGFYAIENHGTEGNRLINAWDDDGETLGCGYWSDNFTNPIGGEQMMFWRHLAEAGLVSLSVSEMYIDITYGVRSDIYTDPGKYYPTAKLGAVNRFIPCSFSNAANTHPQNLPGNYMLMAYLPIGGSPLNQRAGISPQDSYSLDSKIDDGMPNTGQVMTLSGDTDLANGGVYFTTPWAAISTAGKCLKDGASAVDLTATYNVGTGGTTNACYGLMFKTQY